MKNRVFTCICFCLIAFGFAACGDNKNDSNKEDANKQNTIEKNNECYKTNNTNTEPKVLTAQERNELLGISKNEKKLYVLKGMFDKKEMQAYFYVFDGVGMDLIIPDFSNNDKYKSLDLATTKIGFENGLLVIEGVLDDKYTNASGKDEITQKEFRFTQDKDSKLNTLSFITNTFNAKNNNKDNDEITYNSTLTKIFIPQCNNLSTDTYNKLNDNLSMSAKDKSDLSNKMMALLKQKYETKKGELALNYENIEGDDIYFIDSHILELSNTNYEYNGGANGYATTSMQAYSLDSGEELPNDINNVFDIAKSDKLLNLINAKLKEIQDSVTMHADSLPVTELPKTFFIDSNNITFVWQIYEIAPRSSGLIQIPIKLDELKEFVRQDSPYKYLFDK